MIVFSSLASWLKEYMNLSQTPPGMLGFDYFQSDELNLQMVKSGYVKVKIADPELIRKALAEFNEWRQINESDNWNGFINPSEFQDGNCKREQQNLLDVYKPAFFNSLFRSKVQVESGAFLYKTPSSESEVEIHQDAAIVDETQKVALHCWVPLQETSEKNGGLQVFPGSHRLQNPHRSYDIPWKYRRFSQMMKNYLMPVNLSVGEALIYDRRLIHYSPPNRDDNVRAAMVYSASEAPFKFMHMTKDEHVSRLVKMYIVDKDYLLNPDKYSETYLSSLLLKTEKINDQVYSKLLMKSLFSKAYKVALD